MTEYYTVKRIDNSRLLRPAAPGRTRELWRRAAWGAALAACLLFYAWQHFQCIQLQYRLAQLDSQREQAAELNQELHLEIATLRAPMRVDAMAHQLGLTVPVPGQVTPVQEPPEGVLAEAATVAPVPRP